MRLLPLLLLKLGYLVTFVVVSTFPRRSRCRCLLFIGDSFGVAIAVAVATLQQF